MKHAQFTLANVHRDTPGFPRIFVDTDNLVYCPLWWQKQGLQQTASGYGHKLITALKIDFEGKLYRLYATCFSNVASVWFTYRGERIYVS